MNNMYAPDYTLSTPRGALEEEINKKKRTVHHEYHDHSTDLPYAASLIRNIDHSDDEDSRKRRGPRGGVAVPFPEKLHMMLCSVERDGHADIVSWQFHGRCFVVHKPKDFVAIIMPTYFRQTKLTSFQRQLNLYGFCRLTSGRDRGGYYHELFLRGKPFLCKRIMRTKIKGTGIKSASSPQTEPDFYAMPPLKDFSQSSSSLDGILTTLQNSYSSATNKNVNNAPSQTSLQQTEAQTTGIPALVTPEAQTTCVPALVTPLLPVMVTPIQLPILNPPEFPFEMNLSDPQPDTLINFEGQQFHYLDPDSFISTRAITMPSSTEWGNNNPFSGIVQI